MSCTGLTTDDVYDGTSLRRRRQHPSSCSATESAPKPSTESSGPKKPRGQSDYRAPAHELEEKLVVVKNITEQCRLQPHLRVDVIARCFGIAKSTFYNWRDDLEAQGLLPPRKKTSKVVNITRTPLVDPSLTEVSAASKVTLTTPDGWVFDGLSVVEARAFYLS